MSNTFKGTPGLWKADKNLIFSDDFFQTHIAKISPTSFDTETRKANTKLIAHAPEMLEMLQEVSKLKSDNYGDGSGTHLKLLDLSKRLNDLITRATTI